VMHKVMYDFKEHEGAKALLHNAEAKASGIVYLEHTSCQITVNDTDKWIVHGSPVC